MSTFLACFSAGYEVRVHALYGEGLKSFHRVVNLSDVFLTLVEENVLVCFKRSVLMCRPHPNECSGSDLDGDLYFVSWDEALIPPEIDVPMDYCPPGAMILDHVVTVEVSALVLSLLYVKCRLLLFMSLFCNRLWPSVL